MGLEPVQRRSIPWKFIAPFLVVAFAGGAISGAAVSLLFDSDNGGSTSGSATNERVVVSEENAITEAVSLAGPAVVTVINEQPARQDSQGRVVESVSVGSGVVVDERGFVVTNEHVINNPGKLRVVLNDGEERPATVVSHDAPFTDLAVLRMAPGGLRALKFGNSDSLNLGQTVIAMGSALFEYRNSVSVGVVSGLQRRWLREGVYMEDLVQTDAAINSGNSGGPLLNTSGEVVGLTTNVVRRIGTVDNVFGISFAISSKTMSPIVESIIQRGFYPRPYIGIDHTDLDPEIAAANNLRIDRGAIVRRVIASSPADRAGLRPGDIILGLGRYELNSELPYINALGRFGTSERISIQVFRDGRTQDLTLELEPR